MFRVILENELRKRGLSVREAAKEIGISHSTLIAAREGNRNIDLETALAIAKWAGVPLSTVVKEADPEAYKENKLFEALAIVLNAAPDLKETFIKAANELETGEISIGDFRDIVEYAAYKINSRKKEHDG